MKKVITFLSAILTCGTMLAQHPGHDRNPEEIALHQSERLKTELDLSEAQFGTVRDINLKYAEKISGLRNDTTMQRDEFHGQVKTLREARQKEITEVLSDEQKAKLKSYQEEKKNHHGKKHGMHGGKKHDHMKSSLGLSDEQSGKFDAEHESFKKKTKAIREDGNLSDEAKKSKMKEAHAEHDKNVKTVLNADQYKKWKEMKKQHHENTKKGVKKEQQFEK